MKIEISRLMQVTLAEHYAIQIHQAVVRMHLRRSAGIWPIDFTENPFPGEDEEIKAIRVAIASIEDRWDRRDFVATIRFYFLKLRKEKGTAPKWQDYVESVKRAYAEHCANLEAYEAARARLKEGATGCIPQLEAA